MDSWAEPDSRKDRKNKEIYRDRETERKKRKRMKRIPFNLFLIPFWFLFNSILSFISFLPRVWDLFCVASFPEKRWEREEERDRRKQMTDRAIKRFFFLWWADRHFNNELWRGKWSIRGGSACLTPCDPRLQAGMRKRWILVPSPPLPLPPKCSYFISSYRVLRCDCRQKRCITCIIFIIEKITMHH